MAEKGNVPEKVSAMSENDPLDINELASLNEDFSPEFLEQLQNQLTQNALGVEQTADGDDSQLFEEVENSVEVTEKTTESDVTEKKEDNSSETTEVAPKTTKLKLDDSIDDNFIKKYKAKLNKQQTTSQAGVEEGAPKKSKFAAFETPENDIGNLTGGNIVEKPVLKEVVSYNDSLDLLDENVKYSKYVIYIDPENTDFIESLTVKERKNLINKILREQDDVMLTKRRFNTVQAIIKHSIVAIITVAIAIPIIYFTVNASLEASIDNYRRSKSMFNTLYKERGKIKPQHRH